MTKTMEREAFLAFMEEYAPRRLACDWDNVGMLLDMGAVAYKKVMVALDLRQSVVEEALAQKVDLIVIHHPVLFSPVQRLSIFDAEQQWLMMLIQNHISLFAAHTNLDAAPRGINRRLADMLELQEQVSLEPRGQKYQKLVVFVPESHAENLRSALADAGAGHIGQYAACSFSVQGKGRFMPLAGTKPFVGQEGKLEEVSEIRLETIAPREKMQAVLAAMRENHPYEEIAYDLYEVEQLDEQVGLSRMGKLKERMKGEAFCAYVKEKLGIPHVRAAGNMGRPIETVAVSCGAGFDSAELAKMAGVQALVSSELKHHVALTAGENGVLLVDAGHYETEHIIVEQLIGSLQERFNRVQYNTEFILCKGETPLIQTL